MRFGRLLLLTRVVGTLGFIPAFAGCEKGAPEAVENAVPSPNASILPAPLSSAAQPSAETPLASTTAATPITPRSAVDGPTATPSALRSDQEATADSMSQRELSGVSLEAEWHYPDLPPPPKAPEVNVAGIEAARKSTAFRWAIDLANVGRMRVLFDSRAFPLAKGTELRSRIERHGHILVWPNGSEYRTLPPGGVRTLLGERRVDATPLVRPQSVSSSEGLHRLGILTRKWELSTRTGKLTLEQGKMPGAGDGASLLCRLLSELVAIDPSAAPCASDEVPLRAQYTWPQGGSIVFEVTSFSDHVDFASAQMAAPPSSATFTALGLPDEGNGIFLTREELASFRAKLLDLGPPQPPFATAREGLAAQNATDMLRYVFLDSVPVAWVQPSREQLISGPPRGRYLVQWRSFFGDAVEPPITIELPAHVSVGLPIVDAGAPVRDK